MRHLALALTIALPAIHSLPSPAEAQSRPSTTRLTCAAATALVTRSRAIVLDTGDGTYDRYVVDRSQCLGQEAVRPAWARTTDNPQCVLGYVCAPRLGNTSR